MKPQKSKNTRRKWIVGVASAATFGALMLAPASGWLVRAQIRAAVGQLPELTSVLPSSALDDRAVRAARIAAEPQFRNDMGLQMAAAQMRASTTRLTASGAPYSTGSQVADALMPLGGTWTKPDPVLMASVLRYMSQDAVHVDEQADRAAVALLDNRKPDDNTPKPAKDASAKDRLEQWRLLCYRGEIADSDNAYFPLMDAVGRFAAGKTDEGVATLILASEKPRYNEYLAEETEGRWHLNRELQGESGTIANMAISASQLLPHYAQIRAAGRIALAEAVLAEMAGDTEKGFQIRRALTRIGALLRTDSTFMIGGFVGRAVGLQAWARPGGVPPLPPAKTEAERKNRQAEERARYCDYLAKTGHGEAAAEVVWEDNAAQAHVKLWERAEEDPHNLLELQPIRRLMTQWVVGAGLLTNLVVLLLVGGVCALIARWNARVRAGLPLSPAARAGMVTALAVPAIGVGAALFWPEPVSLVFILGGAGALCVSVLGSVRRRALSPSPLPKEANAAAEAMPNVRAFLGAMGLTVVAGGVFIALGCAGPLQALRITDTLWGLKPSDDSPVLMQLASAGASSGVSLLLVLGLTVYSRIRRVPATVGVTRGMRRLALPVAALLVFVYAGLTLNTLRNEARATADLQTCVRIGESAYIAHLLHETSPTRYPNKSASVTRPFVILDDYNGPPSGIVGAGKSAK